MSSDLPVPSLDDESIWQYNTYLFDADGVLWKDTEVIPGATNFLQKLVEKGKQVFVVTNNATKTVQQYVMKLKNLGFGMITESNIVCPNVVMVDFFKRNPHFVSKGIYLIGNEAIKTTMESNFNVECFGTGPDPMPECPSFLNYVDIEKKASAVIVSYDPHFSYPKIMKAVNYLRDPNCGFFVTNEDTTIVMPGCDFLVPESGAMSSVIRAVASPREPTVFGKPCETLARYLMANFNIDKEQTIMFGDRLDTDIKFGNSNGFATCWMRTGVCSISDVHRAQDGPDPTLVPQFTYSFEQHCE